MRKLQKALQAQGIIITISTDEFFSYQQKRFISCYVVEKEKEMIIQSCSQIEIIYKLKEMLDTGKEPKEKRK